MNRQGFEDAECFIGTEVEHTPAWGMKTLFVIGVQEPAVLEKMLADPFAQVGTGIRHIYFGANQSFPRQKINADTWSKWEQMIEHFLDRDYWCTLDIDISQVEDFHESGLTEYRRFIPMISAKIPYVNLLNYNAVLKIDDRDFESTNPGVWCHRVHDLMMPAKFTDWDLYTKDTVIKQD